MADGVDELEAALALVEPLGIDVHLRSLEGCQVRLTGTSFMAPLAGTYSVLVMTARGHPVLEAPITANGRPACVVAGDMVNLDGDELAGIIYEVINRGVFLAREAVD